MLLYILHSWGFENGSLLEKNTFDLGRCATSVTLIFAHCSEMLRIRLSEQKTSLFSFLEPQSTATFPLALYSIPLLLLNTFQVAWSLQLFLLRCDQLLENITRACFVEPFRVDLHWENFKFPLISENCKHFAAAIWWLVLTKCPKLWSNTRMESFP